MAKKAKTKEPKVSGGDVELEERIETERTTAEDRMKQRAAEDALTPLTKADADGRLSPRGHDKIGA